MVFVTLLSVDEIFQCDLGIERYRALLTVVLFKMLCQVFLLLSLDGWCIVIQVTFPIILSCFQYSTMFCISVGKCGYQILERSRQANSRGLCPWKTVFCVHSRR